MKILFIKPRTYLFGNIPDIGIGYLATIARKSGYTPVIFDFALYKKPLSSLKNLLQKERFELVGIKLYTEDLIFLQRILKLVKEGLPDAVIIAGGPHQDPENLLKDYPLIDYFFLAEAEVSFEAFLNIFQEKGFHKKLNIVPGLAYRDKNRIKISPPLLPPNLDEIDFPAWDLIDPNLFPYEFNPLLPYYPSAPIIATRGCPFKCAFCSAHLMSGRKIRRRSVENVIEEIKFLHNNYGVSDFRFLDENLTIQREYAFALCDAILSLPFKITWSIPYGIYAMSIEKKMFQIMERAGLRFVAISIESGSHRIIKKMHKPIDLKAVPEKIEILKRYTHIQTAGLFILGYPGETREDIKATLNLAEKLNLDSNLFFLFTPLPGSEIYNELLRNGELKKILYETYDYEKVSYMPKGITKQELESYRRTAYLRTWIRLKWIKRYKNILYYGNHSIFYFLSRGIPFLLRGAFSYLGIGD